MTVLFIHGIDQVEYTSDQLLTSWTSYIDIASPSLLLNTPTEMAYYAKTLAEFTSGGFSSAISMGSNLNNSNSSELNFCYDILNEIAAINGLDISTALEATCINGNDIIPMGNSLLRTLVRIASALENKAPQRTEIVLRLLKQAYTYLSMQSARKAVDNVVRPLIEQRPRILIAHSLGTVIAYNILQQLENEGSSINIPLFVTLGSPLSLAAVKARINTPRKKPNIVQRWVNYYDTSDLVTLGRSLDINTFAENIENDGTVNNKSRNAHNVAGYLPHHNFIDLLRTIL